MMLQKSFWILDQVKMDKSSVLLFNFDADASFDRETSKKHSAVCWLWMFQQLDPVAVSS